MHAWLLQLTLGLLTKAESLVLSSNNEPVRVGTADLTLLGHTFEAELILRKKG